MMASSHKADHCNDARVDIVIDQLPGVFSTANTTTTTSLFSGTLNTNPALKKRKVSEKQNACDTRKNTCTTRHVEVDARRIMARDNDDLGAAAQSLPADNAGDTDKTSAYVSTSKKIISTSKTTTAPTAGSAGEAATSKCAAGFDVHLGAGAPAHREEDELSQRTSEEESFDSDDSFSFDEETSEFVQYFTKHHPVPLLAVPLVTLKERFFLNGLVDDFPDFKPALKNILEWKPKPASGKMRPRVPKTNTKQAVDGSSNFSARTAATAPANVTNSNTHSNNSTSTTTAAIKKAVAAKVAAAEPKAKSSSSASGAVASAREPWLSFDACCAGKQEDEDIKKTISDTRPLPLSAAASTTPGRATASTASGVKAEREEAEQEGEMGGSSAAAPPGPLSSTSSSTSSNSGSSSSNSTNSSSTDESLNGAGGGLQQNPSQDSFTEAILQMKEDTWGHVFLPRPVRPLRQLYYELHRRFLYSEEGLAVFRSWYLRGRWGCCRRVRCQLAKLLPVGVSTALGHQDASESEEESRHAGDAKKLRGDETSARSGSQPAAGPPKLRLGLYCPSCQEIYAPSEILPTLPPVGRNGKPSAQSVKSVQIFGENKKATAKFSSSFVAQRTALVRALDEEVACAFGDGLPGLFFLTYPQLLPVRRVLPTVPRLFGFKLWNGAKTQQRTVDSSCSEQQQHDQSDVVGGLVEAGARDHFAETRIGTVEGTPSRDFVLVKVANKISAGIIDRRRALEAITVRKIRPTKSASSAEAGSWGGRILPTQHAREYLKEKGIIKVSGVSEGAGDEKIMPPSPAPRGPLDSNSVAEVLAGSASTVTTRTTALDLNICEPPWIGREQLACLVRPNWGVHLPKVARLLSANVDFLQFPRGPPGGGRELKPAGSEGSPLLADHSVSSTEVDVKATLDPFLKQVLEQRVHDPAFCLPEFLQTVAGLEVTPPRYKRLNRAVDTDLRDVGRVIAVKKYPFEFEVAMRVAKRLGEAKQSGMEANPVMVTEEDGVVDIMDHLKMWAARVANTFEKKRFDKGRPPFASDQQQEVQPRPGVLLGGALTGSTVEKVESGPAGGAAAGGAENVGASPEDALSSSTASLSATTASSSGAAVISPSLWPSSDETTTHAKALPHHDVRFVTNLKKAEKILSQRIELRKKVKNPFATTKQVTDWLKGNHNAVGSLEGLKRALPVMIEQRTRTGVEVLDELTRAGVGEVDDVDSSCGEGSCGDETDERELTMLRLMDCEFFGTWLPED